MFDIRCEVLRLYMRLMAALQKSYEGRQRKFLPRSWLCRKGVHPSVLGDRDGVMKEMMISLFPSPITLLMLLLRAKRRRFERRGNDIGLLMLYCSTSNVFSNRMRGYIQPSLYQVESVAKDSS